MYATMQMTHVLRQTTCVPSIEKLDIRDIG